MLNTHRFKVQFDANPTDPHLLIIKEGKPNLLPDSISGEAPEVEKTGWRFDAFYDGATRLKSLPEEERNSEVKRIRKAAAALLKPSSEI